MNGGRRLVYFVNFLAATGAFVGFVNCGGGAHPQVSDPDPAPTGDAAPPTNTGDADVTPADVTISGFDPDKGILFGDQGFTSCGSQASDKVISIKNNTANPISFVASLTSGDKFYKIDKTTGTVSAHGQETVLVSPLAIPQESDITTDLYAGELQITAPSDKGSTVGSGPVVIRLHQTAKGAIITSTMTSTAFDFGNVKVNSQGKTQFSLTNVGNAEATANWVLGTQDFTIDGNQTASAKLAPNDTVSKALAFNPSAIQSYSDLLSLSFNASAVFCKKPPANVNLKGAGTSSVTVTPATLDFGLVDCGTTANFLTVTVTSTIDGTFTPTLDNGTTYYTLATSSGVPLPPGNPINLSATVPYVLHVVPRAVPIPANTSADFYSDKLTIETSSPGDTPHVINLKETARGAILSVSPATITNTGSVNQIFNDSINVVNSGNAPASFTLAVTDYTPSPGHATFDLNLTTGSAQIGSTPRQLTVTLPSTFNTTDTASLQLGVGPGAVLCQDLPGKYALQAQTGAGTSITVNPGSLNFGQVPCNTSAPYKTLTITSIVNTTITPTLGKGATSSFTLADNSGTALVLGNAINLTANTPYTMRIVPTTVPVPSSTADNALGDTLTLTSPVDPVKTIALSETALGAVFSFTPTSINAANSPPPISFTLKNDGNAAGNYTLVSTAGSLNGTTGTLAGKTSLPGVLTKTGDGTISVTSTSTLCSDLPAPIVVSTPP